MLTAGASPAPAAASRGTPKTIVTVHSSAFCTSLREGVAPELNGLMRNDALIALGRSALIEMNREATYGGYLSSSYNRQGGATVVLSPGVHGLFINRERDIVAALEKNAETIDALSRDPARFPEPSATAEQATLSAIESELWEVVSDQRLVIKALSGEVETDALDDLFDANPSTGSAALNGPGPLEAQESAHDPSLRIEALAYPGFQSFGNSAYGKFAGAVSRGQKYIAVSEAIVARTVLENAGSCVQKP